jgi:hypothetical protein
MFSDPLPDSVVSTPRTSETAALAAAMIIAGSFPKIASFAARVAGAPHKPKVAGPAAPKPQRAAKRRNGMVGPAARDRHRDERRPTNATSGW